MDQLLSPTGPTGLIVMAALLAVVSAVAQRSPALRRRWLDRFAGKVALDVPDDLRPDLETALADRNLAASLGAAAGIAAIACAGLLLGVPDALPGGDGAVPSLWGLIVAGAAMAGAAAGAGWSGTRQAVRRSVVTGSRIARPTALGLADYVTMLELQGARVMAVLPAVTLSILIAVALVSDTVAIGEVIGAGTIVAVAVALVALIAGELVGRRLLERPQAAGSSTELAWSDAIRARVLRDVVTAPLAIGVYATAGVLVIAAASVSDEVVADTITAVSGVVIVAMVLVAVISTASRPQRHFRRRLWPRDGAPYPAAGSAPTGASS